MHFDMVSSNTAWGGVKNANANANAKVKLELELENANAKVKLEVRVRHFARAGTVKASAIIVPGNVRY